MALPTSSSLITYLRADATTEGALIDSMLTGSIAVIESYLGTSITAVSCSDQINDTNIRILGYPRRINLTTYPVVSSSVVITSLYGPAPVLYQVDAERGIINKDPNGMNSFPQYTGYGNTLPFVVTYIGGFATSPNYTNSYEPIIAQCIRDIVTDWYSSRNPRIQSEGESGPTVTYFGSLIPPRTKALLESLRRPIR